MPAIAEGDGGRYHDSMRTVLPALLLVAGVAHAEGINWDFEGYPRVHEAAAAAKRSGKRLLIGLSGAPT